MSEQTKEFIHPTSGAVYELRPSSRALVSKASANMKAKGIRVILGQMTVDESVAFQLEIAKLSISRVRAADGSDISTKDVEKSLHENGPLTDWVSRKSTEYANEVYPEIEAERGN